MQFKFQKKLFYLTIFLININNLFSTKKLKSLVKQNKLINNNNQTVLNLIGKFSSLAKVTHSIGLSFTLHLKLHQFFFN